jgi:hypothetical protein
MEKLEKRQIIILVVAALCVLYAAYEFLIARPAAQKAKQQAASSSAVESFDVASLTGDLTGYKASGVELYIEQKAEMGWAESPFWNKAAYQEFAGREAAGSTTVQIIYSGYIDAGRKKVAILNGAEYVTGETLELEDYVLKSVKSSNVIIVNRKTGVELDVPIQE